MSNEQEPQYYTHCICSRSIPGSIACEKCRHRAVHVWDPWCGSSCSIHYPGEGSTCIWVQEAQRERKGVMPVTGGLVDPSIGPRGNGGEGEAQYTHANLVEMARRWLRNRCSAVFTEFSAAGAYENPDAIGWRGQVSILIECKVSRSDFRSDAKKMVRRFSRNGMGRYRYFLCPSGLIHVEDLPDKWGLLWAKKGRIYTKHQSEPFSEIGLGSEIAFLVSMLRRAQVRLGEQDLSDWLRWANRNSRSDSSAIGIIEKETS